MKHGKTYLRATHHFGELQLTRLRVVTLRCCVELGKDIGKSAIMRAALDMLIDDFERNGPDAYLVKHHERNQGGPE